MARRPLQLLTTITLTLQAGCLLAGCSAAPTPSATSGTGRTTTSRNGDALNPSPSAGSRSTPPATAPTTRPARPSVAATAPPSATATADDVALGAVRAWLSYDTRIDSRPDDTALRLALPFLTPELRRDLQTHTPAAAPGVDWDTWTSHHAYATVTVRLSRDDHPPDTTTVAWRQVLATVTLRGDPDWDGQVLQQSQFLRLTRTAQGWRVAELTASHGT